MSSPKLSALEAMKENLQGRLERILIPGARPPRAKKSKKPKAKKNLSEKRAALSNEHSLALDAKEQSSITESKTSASSVSNVSETKAALSEMQTLATDDTKQSFIEEPETDISSNNSIGAELGVTVLRPTSISDILYMPSPAPAETPHTFNASSTQHEAPSAYFHYVAMCNQQHVRPMPVKHFNIHSSLVEMAIGQQTQDIRDDLTAVFQNSTTWANIAANSNMMLNEVSTFVRQFHESQLAMNANLADMQNNLGGQIASLSHDCCNSVLRTKGEILTKVENQFGAAHSWQSSQLAAFEKAVLEKLSAAVKHEVGTKMIQMEAQVARNIESCVNKKVQVVMAELTSQLNERILPSMEDCITDNLGDQIDMRLSETVDQLDTKARETAIKHALELEQINHRISEQNREIALCRHKSELSAIEEAVLIELEETLLSQTQTLENNLRARIAETEAECAENELLIRRVENKLVKREQDLLELSQDFDEAIGAHEKLSVKLELLEQKVQQQQAEILSEKKMNRYQGVEVTKANRALEAIRCNGQRLEKKMDDGFVAVENRQCQIVEELRETEKVSKGTWALQQLVNGLFVIGWAMRFAGC